MKNKYIPYWRGTDFEEALILESAGAILADVEWDYEGETGTFVFEDEEVCNEILDKHKRKDLWLLSQDVLSAYRNVKNELFRRR
ncbi:MAG: hypothetical protein HOC36_02895 [Candidatus Magasanikbacteria bacterium]|jgi:hypothetical protein|nr:hypothetical protein [Candidatus Magasanikbacteria bacterium]MBT4547269.1 hypothetical protein [Candidatus Magasanikbacteria bacterium]